MSGVFFVIDGIDKLNKDELEICMLLILMFVWCSYYLIKINYMLICYDLFWIYLSFIVLVFYLLFIVKYIIWFWLKLNVFG